MNFEDELFRIFDEFDSQIYSEVKKYFSEYLKEDLIEGIKEKMIYCTDEIYSRVIDAYKKDQNQIREKLNNVLKELA